MNIKRLLHSILHNTRDVIRNLVRYRLSGKSRTHNKKA